MRKDAALRIFQGLSQRERCGVYGELEMFSPPSFKRGRRIVASPNDLLGSRFPAQPIDAKISEVADGTSGRRANRPKSGGEGSL